MYAIPIQEEPDPETGERPAVCELSTGQVKRLITQLGLEYRKNKYDLLR